MVDSDLIFRLLNIFLEVIAFVLSVLGNLLIIYVVTRNKKLSNKSYKYILSLSITDLLIGIYVIPFGVIKTIESISIDYDQCLYLTSFGLFVYAASLTSVNAVAIDRFWAIYFPFSYRNRRSDFITNVIITTSWILPVFIGAWPLIDRLDENHFNGSCISTSVLKFKVINFCGLHVLSGCVMMIVAYGMIYSKIAEHSDERTRVSESELSANPDEHVLRRIQLKCVKTFALIIGVYIICWTPTAITFLIVGYTENTEIFNGSWILRIVYILSMSASHLNSAINPFIYAYRCKEIKDSIKELAQHFKKDKNRSKQERRLKS